MNKCVLDASAILALFNQETGADIVVQLLPLSIMSVVNVSEVLVELDKKLNINPNEGSKLISRTINKIIELDFNSAIGIAKLRRLTVASGISLGDRSCIELGISLNVPIYTADKAWSKLNLNCDIRFIR